MYEFEEGKIVFSEYNGTWHLQAYSTGIRNLYVKSIAREVESILKDESGIRGRWVSKRLLFRQIESAFTDLAVQQHAHPSFLGRQNNTMCTYQN